jgi:hypothetical protein
MKLSFVVPSCQPNIRALGAIANICSLANDDVEVIVRDTSGNKEKREFLDRLQTDHCHIHYADFCEMFENVEETARLARGEFVFACCDDDFVDPLALPAIMSNIDSIIDDPSFAGITGNYLFSHSDGSDLFCLQPLDDVNAAMRYAALVRSGGHPITWSVHRRSRFIESINLIRTLPVDFAYHDQFVTLLMLMSGRYANIHRVIYYQDVSRNHTFESDRAVNIHFLNKYGLEPELYRAYNLICIVEGSKIILGSDLVKNLPQPERIGVMRAWCTKWFLPYKRDYPRYPPLAEPLSPIHRAIVHVCDKWAYGNKLDIDEILTDLSGLLAQSSPELARNYYHFWSRYGQTDA